MIAGLRDVSRLFSRLALVYFCQSRERSIVLCTEEMTCGEYIRFITGRLVTFTILELPCFMCVSHDC